jgi:hypothetical protein
MGWIGKFVSTQRDWVWRVGGRPHRFLHNNFSSVYQIFTKLGHMIPLWKGKNPIYFRVIRSKFKVTVTINRNFDNVVKFVKDPIYRTSYRAETTLLSKIIFIVTVTLTFDLRTPK